MQEGANAAVNNPGSAYGVSALGPGAGSAGDSTPSNPDAQAGTRPQPVPSQPLQDGDTAVQVDGEDGESQAGSEQQGLALPFEPVALVFKDIHYYVKQGGGDLELLRVRVCIFDRSALSTALMRRVCGNCKYQSRSQGDSRSSAICIPRALYICILLHAGFTGTLCVNA